MISDARLDELIEWHEAFPLNQNGKATLAALRELRVLRARHKEAVGLLREIRPQVDMVRGTWFDRTDAFLAQESEP